MITEGLISELGGERAVLLVRSAEGNSPLLGKFASELVVDRVDVILAIGSGSLEAARQASQTIPIVALDLESDPIATACWRGPSAGREGAWGSLDHLVGQRRGAKPAEFPIQRPVYMPFLINMHTAKLLKLTIPPSLSAGSDGFFIE